MSSFHVIVSFVLIICQDSMILNFVSVQYHRAYREKSGELEAAKENLERMKDEKG